MNNNEKKKSIFARKNHPFVCIDLEFGFENGCFRVITERVFRVYSDSSCLCNTQWFAKYHHFIVILQQPIRTVCTEDFRSLKVPHTVCLLQQKKKIFHSICKMLFRENILYIISKTIIFLFFRFNNNPSLIFHWLVFLLLFYNSFPINQ